MVSEGVLNVTDPSALVTVGRIDSNTDTVAGGINIGSARTGTGTINLSAGEIQSVARVYLGGDATSGTDAGTTGNLNISGTGLLTVGVDPNGGTNGLNGTIIGVNGMTRDTTVNVGNSNVEVGRDGQGFLSLSDMGQLIIARGNLVLGQDGPDNNNELGQVAATPLGNMSRGTITASGNSVIQVGSTQGVDANDGMEELHDLNYNGGGGDITLSGNAMVSVERNINCLLYTSDAADE